MIRRCPKCGTGVPYDVMKQQRVCPRCRQEVSAEEVEDQGFRGRSDVAWMDDDAKWPSPED